MGAIVVTDAYTPRPGATPDRAIRYLREHGPQRLTQLCRGIRASRTELRAACRSAVKHGAIRFEAGVWSVPTSGAI